MIIFWRLMFGHLLADFTLQTNFINNWKRGSIWGMVAHCATHPIVYAALTWNYLPEPWIRLPWFSLNGWACIFIIFAAHFVEDQWRVFTIFKYNTPDNTLYFLWDQIIHYAVIFAVIPVGFRGATPQLFPELWPVFGCLFVLITHASTVFVYFIEKDLYNRLYPGLGEKYISMAERVVLALCFLIPGNAWPLLALMWLSAMHFVRARRYLDLSWFSFYLGGGIAAVCGLLARVIYYSHGT
jgi:hypothetical protein